MVSEKTKIIAQLKSARFRITQARSKVIEFLLKTKLPVTASTICTVLNQRGNKFDRTTIYRELNFLIENNFVRQVRFNGKATHFELNSGHHHHLICIKCNAKKKIVLGKHLEHHEKLILEKEKFKVISHSLEFYGICNNCI
ncbi:MAG: Fur family transcriptional regulator [bacterium]